MADEMFHDKAIPWIAASKSSDQKHICQDHGYQDQVNLFWSNLIQFVPIWTNHSDQIWSNLLKISDIFRVSVY